MLRLGALAAIALAAAAAGLATGAIRDRQGRLVACFSTQSGDLRLLVKGNACRRGERKIRWNERGVAGPVGTAGTAGAPGAPGPPGPPGPPGADGGDGPDRGDGRCRAAAS